ncbi:MAG: PQQ-dependent sugar dehydrogenase [Thermomicrobiales bacterium]
MIREPRLLSRLLPFALAGGLLGAGVAPLAFGPKAVAAQEQSALIVDDAQTANPDLVQTEVADPNGFGISGHTLMAPPGTTISIVAAQLGAPRFMTFDRAGNLLVTTQDDGIVYRYPYANGNLGQPEALITGLNQPASVVLFTAGGTEYLYVGETQQVTRFPYDPAGPVGGEEVVIPDLPTGGHRTRTVAFGRDGMLYLAVGSSCNICEETDQIRATISRANPDGSDLQIIATGLRNPVGLAFQPGTDSLWATVNERDNQGNEIPPDLVTIITAGANYGWPHCQPPDATPQQTGADCANITPPTVGIQAHSAPLGLAFLTGNGVPAALDGDLVVAQHGSWNRQPPAAPKLLQLDFENGAPVAAHDLVTGWQDDNGDRWGRPAGVVVAPDGSLIVSDDQAGLLYRISLGETSS